MIRQFLALTPLCILFLAFSDSTLAGTMYYACLTNSGSVAGISTSPVTCKLSQSSISWNQEGPAGPKGDPGVPGATGPAGPQGPGIMSYMSGLVAVVPLLKACSHEGLSSCQSKSKITVNLIEGQVVDLLTIDLRDLAPVGESQSIEHLAQIEITKQSHPCDGGSGVGSCVRFGIVKGNLWPPYQFALSPAKPVYSTAADPACVSNPAACPVNIQAKLISDSLLTLDLDQAQVSEVTTVSYGAIATATTTYAQGASVATLTAVIWNAGEYKANYIVSVDDCIGINPVTAESRSLNAQEAGTLNFTLVSSGGPITAINECKVSLLAPTGRLYDSIVVRPVQQNP